MELRVDQEQAFRRARRTTWALSVFPLLAAFPAIAGARGLPSPWPLLALGALLVAGLLAISRLQARQLPFRYGPEEARLPVGGADADRLLPALQAHMRRWWLVHVEDARRWPSRYERPLEPAPLRLPFEVAQDGGDLVLRGSAIHVRAAFRFARRRMAQGQA